MSGSRTEIEDAQQTLSAEDRRAQLLLTRGIQTVIDVGANTGQYASRLRGKGYTARILSFEPLTKPFEELTRLASIDPAWECFRLALGGQEADVEMHVSPISWCSSLLELESYQLEIAPQIEYTGTEVIRQTSLDALWPALNPEGTPAYLKIDVQGYEMHVLRGAAAALPSIDLIEVELSFRRLYRGSPTFGEMMDYLRSRGFQLIGVDGIYDDLRTGEGLQADGIFLNQRDDVH